MELLETAARLASEGYDKKLFSVLSRVYTEKKGFGFVYQEGMDGYVKEICDSAVPAEYKLQTYTSFQLPMQLKPGEDTVREWLEKCSPNRLNIAAYFIDAYGYERKLYREIMGKKALFTGFISCASPSALLSFFDEVTEREEKEQITGVIRAVRNSRRRFRYRDTKQVKAVSEKVFASRKVFYTSKIMYCVAFGVPAECLPSRKEISKMLAISVNYEEKTTKDFVTRYHFDFDMSDEALCRYILANKKSDRERTIVAHFAQHVTAVRDEAVKGKLLHLAFKRGGLFRMYAGCMQDGRVDVVKQRRFHYTDEQIEWVKTLPGLDK